MKKNKENFIVGRFDFNICCNFYVLCKIIIMDWSIGINVDYFIATRLNN